MHRKILVAFACVSSISLLAAIVAPLRAQSLADLSRQEEQRRKTINRPAKVYTNKDLGEVPPAPPAPPPAAAGDQAIDASKDKDKETRDKGKDAPAGSAKDQAYWSTRLKGLQSQLDRDQTIVAALETRVNGLSTDFINRGDPSQRAAVERDRQKAVTELDSLKLAIVATRKAIADLEDEARRAGVPPGWLR
jgi:hypothetical protein